MNRSRISAHRKRRVDLTPFLLLIPILTLLTLLILGPEIWALLLSFTDYSPGYSPQFNGVKNYVDTVKDPVFIGSLVRNVIFVLVIVSLEFLVGLGCALLLDHDFPLKRLWLSLLIAPYAISPVVAVVMWRFLLDPSYGAVNYLLSLVGIPAVAWFGTGLTSFIPIVIVDVWKFSPFMMIIAYAALTSLPREIFEAAAIDGASGIQAFLRITLPLITPALLVGLVFRIIFALRTFGIVWILTKGGPGNDTEILALYLYKQSFRFYHFGRGAAVSMFMVIITFILAFGIIKEMYRRIF